MSGMMLNVPHVWTYLTIIVYQRKVLFYYSSLIKKLHVSEVKELAQVHTVESDRAGP